MRHIQFQNQFSQFEKQEQIKAKAAAHKKTKQLVIDYFQTFLVFLFPVEH